MSDELRVGSLFSGIGGFDLGFGRAGLRTAWFCEADPFCQRVLRHHWPAVPVHGDIRGLSALNVETVDVLAGGFPCQDLSVAGRGEGIDGARSGLWAEFARLIGELRPRYVVVENVSALLARGFGRVLGDLAALGYDAEWDCIPAGAVGAPHRRDRVWVVAYPALERHQRPGAARGRRDGPAHRGPAAGADPQLARLEGLGAHAGRAPHAQSRDGRASAPDPEREGPQGDAGGGLQSEWWPAGVAARIRGQWAAEPDVGRVADGVPARVDRLRSLGNALVPQIAELIGHRIVGYERAADALLTKK
jgi:DNA (cytosine-5)-methyltransferase 1